MRPTCLFAVLALSFAGCKTCSTDECGHQTCQESVVMKAPQQKIIVEVPAPAAPTGTAAPTGVAAPQVPVMPQGLAMPQGMPMAPIGATMPMAPIGAGMPLGATVRERTGIGLVFEHINIPIPFPRLIAVPKPTEVTYQVPPTAPAGFAPQMMPVGVPMAMPMAPTGFMPPQAPVCQAPAPQPQGLSPQQTAALLQLLANQPTGTAPPAAPTGTAPAPVVTDQQCDEIIEKCHLLKRLHQLKQHALDAACCPK
jgi:hypothetical protein